MCIRDSRCLDEPARRRLYGEDPVFIFDPLDTRNRPDPIDHAAALITWPIYPRSLQALFEQTFCAGLRDPGKRSLTGQWRQAFAACLDRRQICGACGQETFPETDGAAAAASCWSCGTPLPSPLRLQLGNAVVVAAPDNELHLHHFDPLATESLRHPLARIEAHPDHGAILGLRNLSEKPWRLSLAHGGGIDLEPGQTCNLAPVTAITTPAGPITLLR